MTKESIPISPEDPPVSPAPTVSPTPQDEGGEGGAIEISNAEFLAAVFRELPENASAAICSKPGDPNEGGWTAKRAEDVLEACPPGSK